MLLVLILFFLLGVVAGFLSGVLGIGGGIVVVPGLMYLFKYKLFYHARLINMAAGTSWAIMIFTTGRSFFFRYIDFKPAKWAYKKMVVGLVFGALSGGVCAHYLHPHVIKLIFSLMLLLVAFRLSLPKSQGSHRSPFFQKYLAVFAILSGGVSALVGIGGSAFTVPLLLECGIPLRRAMAVSVALTVTIAPLVAAVYVITGLHAVSLPEGTLGYVYWPAALSVGLGATLAAPLGGRVARKISQVWLARVFALLLVFVSIHLILSA